MTTPVSTEMSSLILPLDHTSCGFWKKKWRRKVEIQELWLKFKIFSENLSRSTFEPPWKNFGLKISMNIALSSWIPPLVIWCRILSNSKPILKPSKLSITLLATNNLTLQLRWLKQGKNYVLPLDSCTLIQKHLSSMLQTFNNWKKPSEESETTEKLWTKLLIHWRRKIIQLPKNHWMTSCTTRSVGDTH